MALQALELSIELIGTLQPLMARTKQRDKSLADPLENDPPLGTAVADTKARARPSLRLRMTSHAKSFWRGRSGLAPHSSFCDSGCSLACAGTNWQQTVGENEK